MKKKPATVCDMDRWICPRDKASWIYWSMAWSMGIDWITFPWRFRKKKTVVLWDSCQVQRLRYGGKMGVCPPEAKLGALGPPDWNQPRFSPPFMARLGRGCGSASRRIFNLRAKPPSIKFPAASESMKTWMFTCLSPLGGGWLIRKSRIVRGHV